MSVIANEVKQSRRKALKNRIVWIAASLTLLAMTRVLDCFGNKCLAMTRVLDCRGKANAFGTTLMLLAMTRAAE